MSSKVRACVVVNGDINTALRKFSKKVDKFGIIEECHLHTFYRKPSDKKRAKRKKAKSKNYNDYFEDFNFIN